MHTANNDGTSILVALIVRFSGKGIREDMLEIRQLVYYTDHADKISTFLSREACTAQ